MFCMLDKNRNLVIWLGVVMYLLAAVMFTLHAPFYPATAQEKGIPPEQYGFVFGVFELSSIFFSLPLGMVITRLGAQFILLSGIFVEGLACILFGFLMYVDGEQEFLTFSFLLRIVESFGHAAMEVAVITILQIKFPDIEAAVAGWTQTGFAVGMVIGPFLGGVLYDVGGFVVPFATLGAVVLLTIIPAYFLYKVDQDFVQEKSQNMVKEVLLVPEIWIGLIGNTLCCFASESFFNPILEPYMRRFNLKGTAVGSVFLCKGLGYLVSTPIWIYASNTKNISPYFLLTISFIFQAVGVAMVGPVPFIPMDPQIWLIVLGMIIMGIGVGGTCTPSFNQMYNACMDKGIEYNTGTKGVLSGLFLTGFNIGGFIGPSIAGVLDGSFGFRYASLIVLISLIVFTVLLIPFALRDPFIRVEREDTKPLIKSEEAKAVMKSEEAKLPIKQ